MEQQRKQGLFSLHVQLTDSVSSTSTTTAAVPANVKTAYDTAVTRASPGSCTGNNVVQTTTTGGVTCYAVPPGTVTSVAAGDGMSFTTITGSGSVTMGTPGTLTSATTNALTSTSHTHAITNYALSGTTNQITVTGAGRVLGAATTLSLPQNIHTGASPTFAGLTVTGTITGNFAVYDTGWVACNDWTNQHLGTAVGGNVVHNLNTPLSNLLVKVLISTDGTDANSFEPEGYYSDAGKRYGYMTYEVDNNNIKVQTAILGIAIILDDGTFTAVDSNNYYYKIKVWRLG